VGPGDSIISDIAVMIEEITLEDLDVTGAALRTAKLTHAFNDPNKELVTVAGTTYLGFNSITEIKFNTPAFIWMLENL
jgi:prophage maintenance system killer protein